MRVRRLCNRCNTPLILKVLRVYILSPNRALIKEKMLRRLCKWLKQLDSKLSTKVSWVRIP